MKIANLSIQGFRSLRNITWSPGDLNVIIGPNCTGKSNLLRCLELLSISAQGKLGRTIQSLGGMESIVWDGQARSIKFVLETKPAHSESETAPDSYDLELVRLGAGSSYKVETERLTNSGKHHPKPTPLKFTVAQWANGETTLRTLDAAQLDYWLKEYSLGSLFRSGELEQMEWGLFCSSKAIPKTKPCLLF